MVDVRRATAAAAAARVFFIRYEMMNVSKPDNNTTSFELFILKKYMKYLFSVLHLLVNYNDRCVAFARLKNALWLIDDAKQTNWKRLMISSVMSTLKDTNREEYFAHIT